MKEKEFESGMTNAQYDSALRAIIKLIETSETVEEAAEKVKEMLTSYDKKK